MRKRYGRARTRLSDAQVAERMFKGADHLFNCRVDMRRDNDILQDAYDDATGAASNLYADPLVKETKDAIYQLDHEIGRVARQMEHLGRTIRKRAK